MTSIQVQRCTSSAHSWRDALYGSWLIDGHADRGALLGAEVANRLHLADFPTGRVIFAEGASAERVYVVVSGIVKITSSTGHGRDVVRALLGPGDVLDEASVFGSEPHGVTATCQSLVRTGWIERAAVHQMLESRPRLSLQWLQALAREVRIREEDIVLMTSLDVPTRVAREILLLAKRFGSPADGGITVSHSLSRQDFADLVGATKESVSRALAAFVERGWIVTSPGRFEILDLDRLRARSGPSPVAGEAPRASADCRRPRGGGGLGSSVAFA